MVSTMQATQPPVLNTVDALWTLIQAQPKRVQYALSARLMENDLIAQAYVRDSLRSAIQEVKEAKRTGRSFQTADDFLKEFE
ncbi:MAG: hypothetical protein MJZ92_01330 [Paludibacteraceae bacterium]|nr:hypothetical protein [Paludibacteraceae bacterium]